jgi:hypothetical protein
VSGLDLDELTKLDATLPALVWGGCKDHPEHNSNRSCWCIRDAADGEPVRSLETREGLVAVRAALPQLIAAARERDELRRQLDLAAQHKKSIEQQLVNSFDHHDEHHRRDDDRWAKAQEALGLQAAWPALFDRMRAVITAARELEKLKSALKYLDAGRGRSALLSARNIDADGQLSVAAELGWKPEKDAG